MGFDVVCEKFWRDVSVPACGERYVTVRGNFVQAGSQGPCAFCSSDEHAVVSSEAFSKVFFFQEAS